MMKRSLFSSALRQNLCLRARIFLQDLSSDPSASPSETEDPAVEPCADTENHADAATAQAKAARVDDAPVDEDEWNKRAAHGYFPGGFDASENSPQRRAFSFMRQAMLRWYKRNLNKCFCVTCIPVMVQIGTHY